MTGATNKRKRIVTRRCEPVRSNDALTASSMNIRKVVRMVIDRGSITSVAHAETTFQKRISVSAISILNG